MKTYNNPFLLENQWSEYECGDPYIMRFNGLYYLYCSSSGEYIKCWSSENLVDFKYEGSVCDDPIITGAYAPEVNYYNGKFYMITSPIGSGHYVLESQSPTGPFHLISDNYGLLIDGSFFVDDDGKRYMLRAGHQGIVVHNMAEDNTIDVNGTTVDAAYLDHWTEGPMIIKRNGYYYLTYTGNHLLSKGYRLSYSVSKTAPDKDYINMKNRTFFLETGDEFHGLGHSSSVLAPDLDSYCLAYHSFDLDNNPRRRSMNIDHLFFNGVRMYSNPIWWEQEAPKMPMYYTRGKGELVEETKGMFIPKEVPEYFTTEWNLNPNGSGVELLYSLNERSYGCLKLNNDFTYQIVENNKDIKSGTYTKAISIENILSIRLAKKEDGTIDIYLNQLHLCSYSTTLEEGKVGIVSNDKHEIGFVAISSYYDGSGDRVAHKAIPGRFDAIHSLEGMEKVEFLENSMAVYGGKFNLNQKYSYEINVKEDGVYNLYGKVKGDCEEVVFKAHHKERETNLKGYLSGKVDSEGYKKILLGNIVLTKGLQQLVLEVDKDEVVVDYFEIIPKKELKSDIVIKDGNLNTENIKIIGHKKQKSLIHKYSGFTCAENHGMAFIGEDGLTDYSIEATINKNKRPSGDVSIYVRATKESWFDAQVKQALFGYRIQVTLDEINLYRENYEELKVASFRIEGVSGEALKLVVEAKASKINIYANQVLVISYDDMEAYLYGKIGFEVTGEGFGIEHFSVSE